MELESIEPDKEFSEDVKDDLRNVILYRMFGDEKYKQAFKFYETARKKINKRGRICLTSNAESVLQEVEKIYKDEEERRKNPDSISFNEADMAVICKEFGVNPATFKKIIDKYNDVHKQMDTRGSGYDDKIR